MSLPWDHGTLRVSTGVFSMDQGILLAKNRIRHDEMTEMTSDEAKLLVI